MSKEMLVIVLGVWTVVVTQLGIPGSWKMILFVLTGSAVAVVGFLLRGETLARGARHGSSFVETSPAHKKISVPTETYDQKDGINSLN